MSRREDIDNAIWDDEDFAQLTAPAKLVYLWSFTNARCGMAGLYKVGVRAIAADTNLSGDDVRDALTELAAGRFLFHEAGVLWVRARVKRLRSRGPGIAKAIAADVGTIDAAHPLRARFLAEYGDCSWPGGLLPELLADLPGTLPEPSREGYLPGTVPGTSREGSVSPAVEPYSRPTREGPGTLQGKGKGKGSRLRSGGSGGRTIRDAGVPAGYVPPDASLAAEVGRPEADVLLAAAQVRAHGGTVDAGSVGEYIRSRPDLFEEETG